jgi:hypothetical protein
MADETITLTLRVSGETKVKVDRAEYEQAKRDGKVDHFLDVHLCNIGGTNTVVEPDGRAYNPHEQWHGPDGPPYERAAPPPAELVDLPHGLDPGQVC